MAATRLRQEDFEMLRIEHLGGGVALVTLNRPERHNAMVATMLDEVERLPQAIQQDDEVRAVVLTGAGRSFCSGAEVMDLFEPTNPWDDLVAAPLRLVRNYLTLDKPVVTAVKGYALGVGCTLALLGDVVIAGRSARFGDTHVSNLGVTAGDGGSALWPLLVGTQAAKYYLFTGEHLEAEEAYRLGLVFRLVDDEQLLGEATALATRFAAGAPLAVRSTKASINRYLQTVIDGVIPYSAAAEALCFQTADHLEAVQAFSEKRPAKFTGT